MPFPRRRKNLAAGTPGVIRRFPAYFTIPVAEHVHSELGDLKHIHNLDKTEIARRIIDYFLLLPTDSQAKILDSFNAQREKEMQAIRRKAGRPPKQKPGVTPTSVLRTIASIPTRAVEPLSLKTKRDNLKLEKVINGPTVYGSVLPD